ncbi:MAG: sugar kinase [Anaerolineales bacterium]|nr:sugar kinase [Anaerolineales bacterium]
MKPKMIAIGEALVEIMRPDIGQPMDRPGTFIGPFASGAPAIMAVAAARLGNPVGFIGAVGEDAFGRLLRNRFVDEGIDCAYLQTPAGHATGVAFVSYELDGSREFVFHLRYAAAGAMYPEQLEADYFSEIEWLHISGSTLVLSAACRETCMRALEYTKANGGKFSFDPNLREALLPVAESRQLYAPFLAAADVLLPTVEEAHALTDNADDDTAAKTLLGDGDKIVVLKRGAAGCSVYSSTGCLDVPGFAVEEIDPTGAGDCFNAAFLTAVSYGWSLEKTARFANAAGALAVTKQGPMEGAPTQSEIEKFIENH